MKKQLLIVSGFSGVGKGTLVEKLTSANPSLSLIRSCTTRAKRSPKENYEFVSKEEFLVRNNKDYFFETAMYQGSENFYGTPKVPIYQAWDNNKIPLLEINTTGFLQLKKHPELSDCLLKSIFIAAEPHDLLFRLQNRQTETIPSIVKRLKAAIRETADISNYDFVLFNHSIEDSVTALEDYIFHGNKSSEGFQKLCFIEQLEQIILNLKDTP